MNRNLRIPHGFAYHQHGSIVMVALFTMAATLTLVMMGAARSVSNLSVADRSIDIQRAFHAAEAGIDDGFRWLRNNPAAALPTSCPPLASLPTGAAITACNITPEDEHINITSTGSISGINQTILLVVQPPVGGIQTPYGAFADYGWFLAQGNSLVDSYDSRLGDYNTLVDTDDDGTVDTLNVFANGYVGTNEPRYNARHNLIKLKSPASHIQGIAYVGPEGDAGNVTTEPGTWITGGKHILASIEEFPIVSPPDECDPDPNNWPDLIADGPGDDQVIAGAGPFCYSTIVIHDAHVFFDSPASVYVKQNVLILGQSEFGHRSRRPSQFTLKAIYDSVDAPDIRNIKVYDESKVYGVIYGPTDSSIYDPPPSPPTEKITDGRKVTVGGEDRDFNLNIHGTVVSSPHVSYNGQVFGAVIAHQIVVGNWDVNSPPDGGNGQIHFDEALLEEGIFDTEEVCAAGPVGDECRASHTFQLRLWNQP